MFRLTIHGARGSFPVSGAAFNRCGGQTSCFSAETAQGLLVIDAGTGLNELSLSLMGRETLPPITFLFTHLHLDHLIGLAAFKPLLRPDADIAFMADPSLLGDWPAALQRLIGAPYWPVELARLGASVRFEHLKRAGAPFERFGIQLGWQALAHPQGCVGYRLESEGRRIVLATDYEFGHETFDREFAEFANSADALIHDAQYTPEELKNRRGWGHSSWEQAVEAASRSRASQLILTSHDPYRSDDDVDGIEAAAKARFPRVSAARAGLVI